MAVYTFFPRDPKGASASFESVELDSLRRVKLVAQKVLSQHPSSTHVEVWREDRIVLKAERNG